MAGYRSRRPTVPNAATSPASAGRERLLFNVGTGTVPSRSVVEAAIAAEAKPTFATSAWAEPRDWGYAGLIAFTAVLLLRPQDHIHVLAPLHLAELCALLGIAPMILHRLAHRLPVFRMTPETSGLILFGAVMLATAPFSIWPGGALDLLINNYLKLVLVFVLMMNTLTTAKRIEQLTWLILVSCGYNAAGVLLDYIRGGRVLEGSRMNGSNSGLFGNPNDLAMVMVTFLPAAVMFAVSRRHSRVGRVAAVFIALLMLVSVVLTQSRGGALGLLAMILALVVLGHKVRRGFAVTAICAVIVGAAFAPAKFWNRMESIVDPKLDETQYSGSREARRVVMQEGIDTFLEFPLTGVGAGQFKNYNPPDRKERWRETHNALIQIASELGIFGLAAFCFLIFRGAVGAARTRRLLASARRRGSDPLRFVMSDADRRFLYAHTVAMTAGLIGWFVCSLFASIAYNWTFYYLLALIVAAHELARHRVNVARAIEAQAMNAGSTRAMKSSRRAIRGAA